MTIKEMAKKLGVSPSTVSMALNNRPGISVKTRNRVLKMAEETGYSAPGLKNKTIGDKGNIQLIIFKKHSKVVGDTPFFSLLVEGLEIGARNYGYQLTITYAVADLFSVDSINNSLMQNHINGVVILATEMDEKDIDEILKIKVPVIALDSYFMGKELDSVIINNVEGSYKATKHLIESGHKEIGHLSSSVPINNFKERKAGYSLALSEHNLESDENYNIRLEPTMEGAYLDMTHYLRNNTKLPTAFFADNDIIAFGAIKALKENNYKIPEDVSIIGFDDMPFCTMLNPPLTTINVDKKAMGKITIDRLIQKIDNKSANFLKTELAVSLIKRDSVRNLTGLGSS